MIELISAAKVDKISETDVSLLEKVVSNQEKCQVPWQIGTCMPGTSDVSVSDVTPCKINDDCLHCCPSVRQQFTVLA